MAQPKKQSSPRKTGLRRSHLVEKLAKRVNRTSPVRVYIGKNKRTTAQVAQPANNQTSKPAKAVESKSAK